jgi:HEAT repeat protein
VEFIFRQYLQFDAASFEHRLLLLLSDSIVVLFALAVGFGLFALALRIRYNRHQRLWLRLHALWSQDILSVLSGDMSPNEFGRLVEPKHELNFVRFLAPYGWRLRGSDLDVLKALAKFYMPHVVRQLHHKDSGARVWAVNVLALFGMPEHEHDVFEALDDPAPLVSMFAASTLLAQRNVHYIRPVMDQFPRFDKWNVQALSALLYGIGPEAIPELESVYLDPARSSRTRAVAAATLERFSDFAIADKAAALLATAPDEEFAVATLRLLTGIGLQHHRQAIYPLCDAESDVLRVNALRTLRALATREDTPRLLRAFDDPSPWVARQAAHGLLEIGELEQLHALAKSDHPRAVLARQMLAERP